MRAVVIKTVGDSEMGAAIAGALGQSVIPLNTREMEMVRAENRRLAALNGVRAEGDEKRWPEVQAELATTYRVKRHGVLYDRLLLAWAMMWLGIFEWVRYFQAWNREG